MAKFGDTLTTSDLSSMPAGGASGTVLTKNSATDYDVGWTAPSGTLILNGTGPPAEGVGSPGNYFLDTAAKILYGPKSTTGYSGDLVANPGTPDGSGTTSTTTWGTAMTAVVAGRITGLRYYRWGGQAAHTTTLVVYRQSDQAELGRATVNNTAGSPAGWVQASLATPIVLSAGTVIRVGYAISVSTVMMGYKLNFTPVSLIPSVLTIGTGCTGAGLPAYPSTDSAHAYFADIVFQTLGSWPVALKSAP